MERIEICIRYVPDFRDDDKTLTMMQTISMMEYRCAKDSEILLENLSRITVNRFVHELEIELDNRKYDPSRRKHAPLTVFNIMYDPSVAPDFYKDSNA